MNERERLPATPPLSGVGAASAIQSANATAAVLDSQALLRGQKEALIAHNGVTYRLQATRQGKLILIK